MAVTIQKTQYEFLADGNTVIFPFQCRVIYKYDLIIMVNGETILNENFKVDGLNNVNGGNVIFNTPPAQGAKVLIVRDIPLERETDYQTNGDFLAETVNRDFDRIWMSLQGTRGDNDNALRIPLGGTDYNALGKRIENVGQPTKPLDAINKQTLDSTTEDIQKDIDKLNGLKGEKGEKGDPGERGESGVTTPLENGYIALSISDDGDLIVHYNDNTVPPNFSISGTDLIYEFE